MQPSTSSGQEISALRRPVYLPTDLRAEWDVLIRNHPNLLLVGESRATHAMLAGMKPYLRLPICEYSPKSAARMPEPLEGTLILQDVAALGLTQQIQLLRWFSRAQDRPHVQVVSATCDPLFSLVETGAFLPDLYYRLNVVRIELAASGEEIL